MPISHILNSRPEKPPSPDPLLPAQDNAAILRTTLLLSRLLPAELAHIIMHYVSLDDPFPRVARVVVQEDHYTKYTWNPVAVRNTAFTNTAPWSERMRAWRVWGVAVLLDLEFVGKGAGCEMEVLVRFWGNKVEVGKAVVNILRGRRVYVWWFTRDGDEEVVRKVEKRPEKMRLEETEFKSVCLRRVKGKGELRCYRSEMSLYLC